MAVAKSTVPRPVPTKSRKRKRLAPGWVPDQHGAWAMVIVPLVLGVVLGGPAWIHLPLTGIWLVGYFGFYAAGLWLKSRRRQKYFPPVRAYGLIAVAFGLWILVQQVDLVIWLPLYLPLLVTSLVCSHRRKDRSLLNDTVLVLATSLMLPVAYYASAGWAGDNWTGVWIAFGLVVLYFFGTVLYVKTVIRERGSRAYLVGSIGFHWGLVATGPLLALVVPATVTWGDAVLLSAFFAILAVRSQVVPRTRATPKQLGIGEIFASVALTVILVVVFM